MVCDESIPNNVKYNIEKNHIIINLSLIASLEHNDTQ